MADSKLSDLTADTNPSASDLLYKVDSTGSNGSDRKVALNKVAGSSVIAETVLGASAASITFSSIPATYRHLRLVFSGRSDDASAGPGGIHLRFNGDSGTNYDYEIVRGNNTTASATATAGAAHLVVGLITRAGDTASKQSVSEVLIPNYADTTFHKVVLAQSWVAVGTAATGFYCDSYGGTWRSTSAVTSITLFANFGNLIAGSTATLYGLRTG